MLGRRVRPRARRSPRSARPRPLILIVEDQRDQRDIYARYLIWRGFRVQTATDGQQALSMARDSHPDLIVMDLALPHLDGWQATRRLKGDSHTWDIPILACTAHVLRGSLERALDSGCDAWLVKPCLPEDLHAEISRVLSRPRPRGPQQVSL
ncbi:MAG TPA: response regulator [Methylomirabilota bacterium]|nr:response regulator [Methylomirabilota bacterium]